MDCLHAAEILSAIYDGAEVEPASVVAAREHCVGCPECAALLTTMNRVSALDRPRASEELVARILDAARAEAAARTDADAIAASTAPVSGIVLPLEPARPRARIAPTWWRPQFAPLLSAAAVVLVVSVVSTYALVRMTGAPDQAMDSASIEIAAGDSEVAGATQDEAATALSAPAAGRTEAAVAQTAPPYVVYQGTVWVRADGVVPLESELASAGMAATDLGLPEGPRDREVLSATTDPGAIHIRGSDGTLVRFAHVTRTLGARRYALTTDAVITMFGTWPTLPSRFAAPTGSDGSPTFVLQGFDDLGRQVYVPAGGDTDAGFAVAPGTDGGDPAAGNPNWTWWQPIP